MNYAIKEMLKGLVNSDLLPPLIHENSRELWPMEELSLVRYQKFNVMYIMSNA